MSSCPHGPWTACPNRYFKDQSNKEVMRQQKEACFSSSTTFNDDLFTGACMAEAHMNSKAHPCFLSYDKELFWTKRRTGKPEKALSHLDWLTENGRCSCPVLVHKVKDALHRHHVARRLHRLCKYKKLEPVGGSAAVLAANISSLEVDRFDALHLLTHYVEAGPGLYEGLRRGCV